MGPTDSMLGEQEQQRKLLFAPGIVEYLGHYVYPLVDPRNREIFYVGKGRRDRAYDHAKAASVSARAGSPTHQKMKRIQGRSLPCSASQDAIVMTDIPATTRVALFAPNHGRS